MSVATVDVKVLCHRLSILQFCVLATFGCKNANYIHINQSNKKVFTDWFMAVYNHNMGYVLG